MNEEKQLKLSAREQWAVLTRLFRYAKPHALSITIAMFMMILNIVGLIISPIIIQRFIDNYLTPLHFPKNELWILGGLYVGVTLMIVIFTYLSLIRFQRVALLIVQQLRIDAFTKVQHLGMSFFNKVPSGSIVSRVTNDTESIKEMFVGVLVTFISAFFMVIGVYIALFALDVKLAFYSLALLPLFIVIISIYRKYSADFYADLRERLSQLNAKMAESISGMSMIQSFRQEERYIKDFEKTNEGHFNAGIRNIKFDSLLLGPAIDLLYALAIVATLSYFGLASLSSPIDVGIIYAFTNLLGRLFNPIHNVMTRFSIFQQAVISAARVFKLLDTEEMEPVQKNDPKARITDGHLEFRNVSFSYDGTQDVLKNISFEARPGETVALVGHTGSGKSSIINLLMRFYEFDRGDIFIDGHPIQSFSQEELRRYVGLVLQDPFLFYGTIADNIRLHDRNMPDRTVQDAAEFVHADTFIDRLPNQYEERVSERGATYSSGERQLIAFARTMATDPKILVLDEATANIDTETEMHIQRSLEKMRKGRTTIAIAHRLSTIQDADLILVMHRGEIAERGTHQQLLAQRGLYYKMYELQKK